jgi:hypothetical protein
MGAAAAAGWMVYQAVGTYNRDFHKSYFYYLITFYAFAIYALMGQQGLRWLLRTGGSTEEFVASAANFLAMLSLPFLFLSWGMLVKMGHNLVESKPANRIFGYHLAFLLTVIVIFWIGYYMLYSENLIGRELIFIEIGLLLLMELGYLVLFVRIVFSGAGKFRPPASRVIRLFAIGTNVRARPRSSPPQRIGDVEAHRLESRQQPGHQSQRRGEHGPYHELARRQEEDRQGAAGGIAAGGDHRPGDRQPEAAAEET